MSLPPIVGWWADGSLRLQAAHPPVHARSLQALIEERGGDPRLLDVAREALLGSPQQLGSRWGSGHYLFDLVPMRTRLGAISGVYGVGRIHKWGQPRGGDTTHPASLHRWLAAWPRGGMLPPSTGRVRQRQDAAQTCAELLAACWADADPARLRVTERLPDVLIPPALLRTARLDELVKVLDHIVRDLADLHGPWMKRPVWLRVHGALDTVEDDLPGGWPRARAGRHLKVSLRCLPAVVLSGVLCRYVTHLYDALDAVGGFGALDHRAADEEAGLTFWLPLPEAQDG